MVAELELNSVIPPPDTIEEANTKLRNQSLLRKPNPHYSTHSVVTMEDFQRDTSIQKWSNELKTRSVNQVLQIDVGLPWN